MSLRKVRYRKEAMADVNMTNLIDVVMVLLIVFILVSNFVQTGLNISLPDVRYADTIGKQKIVVGIDLEGQLTLNSEMIGFEELPARLQGLKEEYPEEGVYINADRQALIEDLANVMSTAKEAGFIQIFLPMNMVTQKKR